MTMNGSNPLLKHFRQPAIYLKLPSQGAYWPEGSLDLPISGDIPIYPMTTKDEIILRTPDALLNGEGMVSVIQSCVPNIRDAWKMPSIDVDAILIAIRIASYGNDMEVDSLCPHCSNQNSHTIDLNQMIDYFRMPDYNNVIHSDGLKIKLKPQSYYTVNKNNMVIFEEQRILQAVSAEDVSDEVRLQKFNEHMIKLVDINMEVLANTTDYIETEDGTRVNDKIFINEFYRNAAGSLVTEIRERIEKMTEEAGTPKIKLVCESCEKEYDTNITFDYSSFFGPKS